VPGRHNVPDTLATEIRLGRPFTADTGQTGPSGIEILLGKDPVRLDAPGEIRDEEKGANGNGYGDDGVNDKDPPGRVSHTFGGMNANGSNKVTSIRDARVSRSMSCTRLLARHQK
jgi:hypothetical protein